MNGDVSVREQAGGGGAKELQIQIGSSGLWGVAVVGGVPEERQNTEPEPQLVIW